MLAEWSQEYEAGTVTKSAGFEDQHHKATAPLLILSIRYNSSCNLLSYHLSIRLKNLLRFLLE